MLKTHQFSKYVLHKMDFSQTQMSKFEMRNDVKTMYLLTLILPTKVQNNYQNNGSIYQSYKNNFYGDVTCSWHQKPKPPVHQFTNLKCCIKARELFKTPNPCLNGVLFLIYPLKNHFKPCFFILKIFCSTLPESLYDDN